MTSIVERRRLLHAHAELAFREIWTASYIQSALAHLGERSGIVLTTGFSALDPAGVVGYPSAEEQRAAADEAIAQGADPEVAERLATEPTGCAIDIPGDRTGPAIGIRFDFDALPIDEDDSSAHLPAREGFRCSSGRMHACGHDGHTAIGIELAARLAANRDFAGRVRLVFQPAEESVRGAAPMIAAGMADDLDVFLGLHLGEGMPAHAVAASAVGLQATTKFTLTFTGVASHAAAAPQAGRNAIAAGATATLGLLGLSRDSRGVTNVNVGTITGGRQSNIVPDHCELGCEVRSDNAEVCAEMYERAQRVADGAALSWDVSAEAERVSYATTMTADPQVVDHCVAAARTVPAIAEVRSESLMSASDDLSLWAEAVQNRGGLATYLVVGASSPAPHHHVRFDIDESVLPLACDWLEAIVRTWPDTLTGTTREDA